MRKGICGITSQNGDSFAVLVLDAIAVDAKVALPASGGEKLSALAGKYGVTASMICVITKRRAWKHII